MVRDYEDTFDAQAVYTKLVDHDLKSTKAMFESTSILSYIASVRLGNGEWNGTTEGFITHFTNQVRLYKRQVSPSDHFSDGQKRIIIEMLFIQSRNFVRSKIMQIFSRLELALR
jgi:hypothetical protein